MQIVRFLSNGQVFQGKRIDDSSALQIEGDLFGGYRVTDRQAEIF